MASPTARTSFGRLAAYGKGLPEGSLLEKRLAAREVAQNILPVDDKKVSMF